MVPKAGPSQTLIRRSTVGGANLATVPALYAPNPEAAKRFIVIVDDSKLVKQLGVGELPVEVLPFLWRTTAERLTALGASLTVRGGEETPYVTDNSNLILDLTFEGGIKDAPGCSDAIKKTTGVVEHGLFIGMTDTLIVGGPDGPKVVGRLSGGAA